MANVVNGNTFYVDTASSASVTGSFIDEKDILLEAIVFNAHANHAYIELCDLAYVNGAFQAGDKKLHVHSNDLELQYIHLRGTPIRFPNGIWISHISDGADPSNATLILKRKG